MQCLQPVAEDKPKSAWRCSFCLDHHETTTISLEEESFIERRGRKRSSLKSRRYNTHLYLIINIYVNKIIKL